MTLPREGRFEDASRYLAPLVARHVPLESARVVEFGCGSGPISEAFARRGASVLGVEINAATPRRGERCWPARRVSTSSCSPGRSTRCWSA